jgi:hypothetical protein
MHRKRILIISYYWIPSGGAGVQRWVKFAKYLRSFGWEPIIYTPSNPEYPSTDASLQNDIPQDIEVIKTPIWEPYNFYRTLLRKKNQPINAGFISEDKPKTWKDKFSVWIRGNFFIPDPRSFWIRPSVGYLTAYLKEHPVDAILSTGPPHSMHLISLGLKKNFPDITWIADFRDPWTNIDFYKDLNVNFLTDYIHRRLEAKVIRSADSVVVVSQGMKEEFQLLKPARLQVITNGYDISDISKDAVPLDTKFSLSHIGTLNAARNPSTLWKVLGEIAAENKIFKSDLEIQLVGKVDFSVLEDIDMNALQSNVVKIDYLSHIDAIAKQRSSQVLLLLINNSDNAKGILTGKFFEYLAAKRPIVAIGPLDGDVATILAETDAGKIADFHDEVATKRIIMDYYSRFKSSDLFVNSNSIENYSRENLTASLVSLLDDLLTRKNH